MSARHPSSHGPSGDGSIDFALLTAIEVERQAVCAALGLGDDQRVKRGSRVYWRGRLPLKSGEFYEVVVAQSPDMANVDAALLTSDMLHDWKPGAALMVGIAASTKPGEVKLGDVVVGADVYYYERGKVTPSGTKPEPKMVPADATLWSNVTALPDLPADLLAHRPDGADDRPRVHFGVIASGEKVLADEAARDQIAAGHRKILAIEMEGYGFSKAVWQSFDRVRHLVIRSICDDGDPAKDDRWHGYAAATAAAYAKHFLFDRPLEPRNATATLRRKRIRRLLGSGILVLASIGCLAKFRASDDGKPALVPVFLPATPGGQQAAPDATASEGKTISGASSDPETAEGKDGGGPPLIEKHARSTRCPRVMVDDIILSVSSTERLHVTFDVRLRRVDRVAVSITRYNIAISAEASSVAAPDALPFQHAYFLHFAWNPPWGPFPLSVFPEPVSPPSLPPYPPMSPSYAPLPPLSLLPTTASYKFPGVLKIGNNAGTLSQALQDADGDLDRFEIRARFAEDLSTKRVSLRIAISYNGNCTAASKYVALNLE